MEGATIHTIREFVLLHADYPRNEGRLCEKDKKGGCVKKRRPRGREEEREEERGREKEAYTHTTPHTHVRAHTRQAGVGMQIKQEGLGFRV